jgi:hypothetical protein
MLYREIGLLFVLKTLQNTHKGTHFGQGVAFYNVKTSFHREIAGLWRVKYLRSLPFGWCCYVTESLDRVDFTTTTISASTLWACNMLTYVFYV